MRMVRLVLSFVACSSLFLVVVVHVKITKKYSQSNSDDDGPRQSPLSLLQEGGFKLRKLQVHTDLIWSPPQDYNETLDGQLIYADELMPSLNSRYIERNCSRNSSLVILVSSALENKDKRDAIRSTWAQDVDRLGITLYFAVGSSDNETLMAMMVYEATEYGDVIQWPFVDSYRNVTIKVLSELSWTLQSCSNVSFVAKVDDDVYLDLDILRSGLNLLDVSYQDSILGFERWVPIYIENPNHRNFVPFSIRKNLNHPSFIVGALEIYGFKAINRILETAKTTLPALWLEDVYITGYLAQKALVSRWALSEKFAHWDCDVRSHRVRTMVRTALIIGHDCTLPNLKLIRQLKH